MSFYYALVIFSSMVGDVLPQINLGVAHLSLFRALMLLSPLVYLYYLKGKSLSIHRISMQKNNSCSLIFMVIWFVYSSISLIWVHDINRWLKHEFFLFIGCFFMLLFEFSDLKQKDYIRIFLGAFWGVVINNFIGWYELFFHKYLFASAEEVAFMFDFKTFYAIAGFGNLNEYSFFMVFGVFIAFYIFDTADNKLLKYFAGVMAVSSGAHVLVSRSRGCGIGLVLGVMILFYFRYSLKKKMMLVLQLLLLGVLLMTAFPDAAFSVIQKIIGQFSFSVNTSQMNSEAVRINLIKNGFLFLRDTFAFGVGGGNTEYWQKNFAIYNTREIINMHNWWMEILVNYGVGFFSFYLLIYIKMIFSFYKGVKKNVNSVNKKLAIMFLSCFVAFIMAGISSSSVFGIEWLWIFWALAISYQGIVADRVPNNIHKRYILEREGK